MWLIQNPDQQYIPTSHAGLALFEVSSEKNLGILCEVTDSPTTPITIPPAVAGLVSVELPKAEIIYSVAAGDRVFTAAVNPDSPQVGEFVWNNQTKTLTLYPGARQLVPGLQLNVSGADANGFQNLTNSNITLPPVTPLPTNWVNPTLFKVFWDLPITGTINWSKSFEQHPSGSISLTVLRSGINLVRSRFAKGKELQFAGVGFSVAGYQEKLLNTHEYPGGVYQVSISLTGRWNRRDYQKPVRWRTGITTVPNSTLELDPDCELGIAKPKTPPSTIYPGNLSIQNNVPLELTGSDWKITVPKDITNDTTTNWLNEVQPRLRQNNAFLLWSAPGAVKAVNINSVNNWSYWVPEIEVSPNGDYARGDGRFGYAVEYPNVKVDGQFSNPNTNTAEDTQGKRIISQEPMWQQRKPVRQTTVNGDPEPHLPPDNTTVLTTLDLNFDVSGPTKSQEITETVDGMLVRRTLLTYGFAYLGRQIYQGENINGVKIYRASANSFWVLTKQEVETFNYDQATGYLLGSYTSGWQTVRFSAENAENPETVLAQISDDPIEQARATIYEFRQAPINGVTAYYLEQYVDYYKDVESPPVIIYKVCNLDGTSRYAYKRDPTYVAPMFISVETTQRSTFIWMPHPDNASEDAKSVDYVPKPDLTCGEETLNRRHIKILPSVNTTNKVAAFLADETAKLGDRFLEYTSQFSASGSKFKDCAEDTKMTTNTGRPNAATIKPSLLERVEPENTSEPTSKKTESPNYEYRLLTPGYTTSNAVQGNVSFPYATTESAVLNAAQTDLKIRDAQESVSVSADVPFNYSIQEFDRINLATKFDTYQLRVMSAAWSVQISGTIDGIPEITSIGGTKLGLGIDRYIPVQLTKVKLPKPNSSDNNTNDTNNLTIINVISKDVTLGSLIPNNIPTRRNR